MEFRRIAGGLRRFKIDGKAVVVRFGGIIECEPEVLGSFIGKYEPVDSRKTMGEKKPLELETMRQEYLLREKSIWFNEERPADNTLVWKVAPRALPGLQRALEDKTDDGLESGNPGELAWTKSRLKAAWTDWKKKCKQDPLRRDDPEQPKDNHLTDIAVLQAQVIVIEAEIKEIRKRIKAAMAPVEANDKRDIERRRWRGVCRKNGNRQIVECDGREVRQNEQDEPVFVDDGQLVREYLEQCKERARARRSEKQVAEAKRTRAARS